MKTAPIFIVIAVVASVLLHLVVLQAAVQFMLDLERGQAEPEESRLFAVQEVANHEPPVITLGHTQWTVEDLVELTRTATAEDQLVQTEEEL